MIHSAFHFRGTCMVNIFMSLCPDSVGMLVSYVHFDLNSLYIIALHKPALFICLSLLLSARYLVKRKGNGGSNQCTPGLFPELIPEPDLPVQGLDQYFFHAG